MTTSSVASVAERREADRVPFAVQALVLHQDAGWFVQIRDLSESGCGVFRPEDCNLAEGNVVRLFFHHGSRTRAIAVSGRVAHVGAEQIGIEYHEPQAVPPEGIG